MQEPSATRIPSVLDDPSSLGVARVYAEALLGAAGDQAADVVEELKLLTETLLNGSTGLEEIFSNRAMGRDEKLAFVEKTFSGRASDSLVRFLLVLANHDRLDLVRAVSHVAELELQKKLGQKQVHVTSAAPLSPQEYEAVVNRLKETMGLEPQVEVKVDPELVGGLVVRVGDMVYDGSLRTRLEQLRAQLRERCLNEIQRGRDRFSYSA
ncbi:ATP synthase subunit delta, sodium ion specific [Planctopirus ephydatiae]|uniref:ATP synthase subunit delta n=1 Tax=Planctopirus ephydatiae TaxID=2528019 RepID=A0A518GKH6_9PLAN|nr:ATP synthase F1 subunit delta [Planctopirus ephydatiae]QDV29067.1 ATP synthase subunit delta, sodium ion specific [Planctopirus ephydatiae]